MPALESQIGQMRFFPRQNFLRESGILQIASINSGGWIKETRDNISFQSFSFNKNNKLLNEKFSSILKEHAKNKTIKNNINNVDNSEELNINSHIEYLEQLKQNQKKKQSRKKK